MSKHYLAREFGLYFNSGQWSGKVQQSPTYAAQPSSFSDNLSMDLISPPSLEWDFPNTAKAEWQHRKFNDLSYVLILT